MCKVSDYTETCVHTTTEYNCSTRLVKLDKTLNWCPSVCEQDQFVHLNIGVFVRTRQFGRTDSRG